jgi:hypothetical protein
MNAKDLAADERAAMELARRFSITRACYQLLVKTLANLSMAKASQ